MKHLRDTFLKAINATGQQSGYAPLAASNSFDSLPQLLQQFFHRCGYTGREHIECAHIKWTHTALKLSYKAPWRPMGCYQVNFLCQPARMVYMKLCMFGLIPVEALDLYKDARGSMSVSLFKIIPLTQATGMEMDTAELVTILAETIMIPHYALQNYISWQVIDHRSIKGIISYNGISASGIFHFNQHSECIRFVTSDRYLTKNDGSYQKTPWTATAGSYMLKDGIRYPTRFTASWHTPEGDFEYFKGRIKSIEFSGSELSGI